MVEIARPANDRHNAGSPFARRLLVWCGIVILLALVVRHTGAEVLRGSAPDVALMLNPNNSVAREVLIESHLVDGKHPVTSLIADARRALARNATSAHALRTLGLAFDEQGDKSRAEAAMRLTERLTRRDLPTQLYLLQKAVDSGDVSEALAHFDVALRTNPETAATLFPVLVNALQDRALWPAFARLFERDPPWAVSFAKSVAGAAGQDATLATMLRAFPHLPLAREPVVRSLILARLSQDGDFAAALSYARSFDRTLNGRIHDPRFTGLSPALPFGWSLRTSGDAQASLGSTDAPGLTIHAPTGHGALVAEQTTVLPSGIYELTTQSSVKTSDDQAGIVLSFGCEGGPTDFRLKLQTRDGHSNVDHSQLVVPTESCVAQRLRITVLPSEDPAGVDATLQGVRIDPVPYAKVKIRHITALQ